MSCFLSLRTHELTRDVAEHELVQEVKWAHFADTVCEAQSFKKLLVRYRFHTVYLEYVTRWYDDKRCCPPLVRKAMDKHLTSLPLVAFSPPLVALAG